MVQAWYMEPYPCGDPRLPHHEFPPKKLTPDEMVKVTGIKYWKIIIDDIQALSKRVTLFKYHNGYTAEDIYTLDGQHTVNFGDKIEDLFEEREEKEDRGVLILEGSAYYDVECADGKWVRLLCEDGDLFIMPSGITFRFTTTPKNYVKMRRFFRKQVE